MHRLHSSLLLVLSLGLTPLAHAAASADICYTAPADVSTCYTPQGCTLPTSSTVFVCPIAGSATLPQLAVAGWSVVQLNSALLYSDINNVGMGTAQLVIQKP